MNNEPTKDANVVHFDSRRLRNKCDDHIRAIAGEFAKQVSDKELDTIEIALDLYRVDSPTDGRTERLTITFDLKKEKL